MLVARSDPPSLANIDLVPPGWNKNGRVTEPLSTTVLRKTILYRAVVRTVMQQLRRRDSAGRGILHRCGTSFGATAMPSKDHFKTGLLPMRVGTALAVTLPFL